MKNLAKRALLRSGLLRLASAVQASGAAILMYHSVLEDPSRQGGSLGGIVHSQSVFSQQMELLARGFHPLSIEELQTMLRGEEKIPNRSVLVTFDDGYRDNCQNALPILDSVGVPATFYITVDCVEKGLPPWPSRVRYALRSTRRKAWSDPAGASWALETEAQRDQAFAKACEYCCRLAGSAQEQLVSGIETQLEVSLPASFGQIMMDWDEVRKIQERGHVIGSHTLSHPNVAQLSLQDAHIELETSRSFLEKQLKQPVTHFSYPCPALSPHWTKQTVGECRKVGYKTAVVTDGGLAHKNDDLLCLRRVRPSKTLEGLRWNLEWAFAGRAM